MYEMTAQNEALQKTMTATIEEINWESVVGDELPRLYNYFRYRLGEETTAEDLTSLVLEKAWLKRHRYRRDRAAFSVWLFAIARNEVVAYLRKRDHTIPLSMTERAEDETAEQVLEHTQDLQRLSQLLGDLPDRERELLALKYGADLNNREIAVLTGLGESNVGTILSRTLQKIREQWEGSR